jgi:hypothetical protein
VKRKTREKRKMDRKERQTNRKEVQERVKERKIGSNKEGCRFNPPPPPCLLGRIHTLGFVHCSLKIKKRVIAEICF